MNNLDWLIIYALQLFVFSMGILLGVLVVMGLKRVLKGRRVVYKDVRRYE